MMVEFEQLVELMRRLRHPQQGCPWDREQTPQSLRQYILEECYELLGAIDEGDAEKIKQEAGDLLLQILFITQIYAEQEKFSIRDVLLTLKEKLICRHPHIFGEVKLKNSKEVKDNWEKIKVGESSKKSIISDYPEQMPALLTAQRIASQVSTVGFDWKNPLQALQKVEEELTELRTEIVNNRLEKCSEEIGDLLFAITNVARLLRINAEFALRATIHKFRERFHYIEKKVREQQKALSEADLNELERLWQESKKSD